LWRDEPFGTAIELPGSIGSSAGESRAVRMTNNRKDKAFSVSGLLRFKGTGRASVLAIATAWALAGIACADSGARATRPSESAGRPTATIAPAEAVKGIRDRIPDGEAAWMRQATAQQLRGCRVRSANGIWLYTPDGVGNYRALWTRDFAYMVMYAGDLLDQREVRACIEYLLRGQRADGCMPDRVKADGKPVYSPGSEARPLADHALDNGAFMALLVCAYADGYGDWEFFRTVEPSLRRGLDHTRRAPNGLVYNPPDRPQCPYGFTDTVAKTGHLLFCSLLYYDACLRMADACERSGCGDAAEYRSRAAKIRKNISILWNDEAGMFWAADKDCKQLDVWGSALAVQVGCATEDQADRIAAYLIRNYSGIVQRGQVRHLPPGETWQRLLTPIKPGTYQNGAYWATPLAWVAPTIARRDLNLAVKTVREAIKDFRERGIAECVSGPRLRVLNYVASATNVYYLTKKTEE